MRSLLVPLLLTVVTVAGLAAWQSGWIEPGTSPTSDTTPVAGPPASRAADPVESRVVDVLEAAGFGYLHVEVAGDRVTLRGNVADESALTTAASLVLGVEGISQLDNLLQVGTPATAPDVQAAAEAALGSFGGVSVSVQDQVAVLTGTVPSEEDRGAAATAVLAVPSITKVDNRLTVDAPVPAGPTLPAAELRTAVEQTLAGAGFQSVSVEVEGRRAVLEGVVPLDAAAAGYFAYVSAAEAAALSVEGIDEAIGRFSLRGDGALLRDALLELTRNNPIVFDVGSADLTAEARAVLDQVVVVIQSQPGLQIFIAGHTDTAGSSQTNEALARQRAEAVRGYLLDRGIPSYRLAVVSYGELFPGRDSTAASDRRIEFEVGP